jgi:hypothetical protein
MQISLWYKVICIENGGAMNKELEQVRYITRFYGMLQGLKALPFGLWVIALALRDIGMASVSIGLTLLALVLFIAANRYYDTRFGSVQLRDRSGQIRELVIFLIVSFFIIVLENVLLLPFSLIGLAVAAYFFLIGIQMKVYYYFPLGVVIVFASFLPWMLGVPITDRMFGSIGFVLAMTIGGTVMIAGLLDHIRLVRGLKLQQGGPHGETE